MRRMYSENQVLQTVEEKSSEKGIKIFENIVDKDGHPRFIEGDIEIETISGATQTFGKWSLSGTHLLIVVAVDFVAGTYTSEKLCEINLPQWVKDKINALYGNVVFYSQFSQFAGGYAGTINAYLAKVDNVIYIQSGSQTPAQTISIRYNFDLLIDNE